MIGKKRESEMSERLDRLGRELVRAAAANEAEGERVAASPFLYTRLSARIKAEREGREERERWFAVLGVVWRTVPAMALVTLLAFVLFLSASFGNNTAGGFSDGDIVGSSDAGIERVFFAERYPLSSDEVLATILNEDERENVR